MLYSRVQCVVFARTTAHRGTVASPGFVVRTGKAGNNGHGALTADSRAGCSSCSMINSFVTNAVLIERAVSWSHLHQLISQTTQ